MAAGRAAVRAWINVLGKHGTTRNIKIFGKIGHHLAKLFFDIFLIVQNQCPDTNLPTCPWIIVPWTYLPQILHYSLGCPEALLRFSLTKRKHSHPSKSLRTIPWGHWKGKCSNIEVRSVIFPPTVCLWTHFTSFFLKMVRYTAKLPWCYKHHLNIQRGSQQTAAE